MTEATIPLVELAERFLRVRGTTLRYFVGGAGPPLVLVHGLGGAAANWGEIVSLLVPRFRILVPDLPGHGGSEPLPASVGMETFADRLSLLAEAEGMRPAAFAGHSFGGAVITALSRRHPGAASAAVLFAPPDLLTFPWRRRAGMAAARALRPAERVVARNRFPVATRPRLRALSFGVWGADDPRALSPRAALCFLDGAAQRLDTTNARRALFAHAAARNVDMGCRVMLVWGARDALVPVEVGYDHARRLGAPLRVLPATGHLVIGERPTECARLLEAFLAE
jgi:pimeloyl-ACP methyl ester carboxylesterase